MHSSNSQPLLFVPVFRTLFSKYRTPFFFALQTREGLSSPILLQQHYLMTLCITVLFSSLLPLIRDNSDHTLNCLPAFHQWQMAWKSTTYCVGCLLCCIAFCCWCQFNATSKVFAFDCPYPKVSFSRNRYWNFADLRGQQIILFWIHGDLENVYDSWHRSLSFH